MALSKMSFDELNELVGYKVSEPFEDYYAPMRISREQKRRRIALAKKLDDVFLWLLAQYFYADQYKVAVSSDIFQQAREMYLLALASSVVPDEYIEAHAMSIITKAVEILLKHKDDPYYYSADRARAIAEGEANSIWNYTEYEEAAKNKSYKTWLTIMDGRERDSHAEVNGITLPIDEPFELQGGLMQYPRSDELGASDDEIIGCRCSLSFS